MALLISENSSKVSICSNTTFTDDTLLSKTAIGLLIEAVILPVAFGNLLVLLSLRYHKKVLVTDILLFSLSLADFIAGIFGLQVLIFTKYLVDKPWSEVLCDMFVVIINTLRFASGGTITLIALERTFLIVFPLRYHIRVTIGKARKGVAVVWLTSLLLGLLPFLGVGHSGFDHGQCSYQFYFLGATTAIVLLTAAFILLFIALVCFIIIKFSGKRFIQRQKVMSSGIENKDIKVSKTTTESRTASLKQKRTSLGSLNKTKGIKEVRRLTRMMTAVIVLYYISYVPVLISNVVILAQQKNSSNAVTISVGMLSLIYALCNPVLYGKMSPRYLKGYKLVFGTALGFCGYRPRSWSTSTTSQSALRNSVPMTVCGTSTSELKDSYNRKPKE